MKNIITLLMMLMLLTTILIGCSGEKDSSETIAEEVTTGDQSLVDSENTTVSLGEERCEVQVEGGVQDSWVGRDNSTVGLASNAGTDYWMTDAELKSAIQVLVKMDRSLSEAQVAAETEKLMGGDPRMLLLVINCIKDQNVSLSLMPASKSQYQDVEFGPGTYPIKSTMAAQPGEFAVIANIDPSASFVAEAGEIEITRFDTAILSGRFEFSAKEQYGDGRSVIVKGQFNYPCKSSDACSAN